MLVPGTVGPLSYLHPAVTGASWAFNRALSCVGSYSGTPVLPSSCCYRCVLSVWLSLVFCWRVPRNPCLTFILLLQVHTEHLTEPCPVLAGTEEPLSYLHPDVTGAYRAFNWALSCVGGYRGTIVLPSSGFYRCMNLQVPSFIQLIFFIWEERVLRESCLTSIILLQVGALWHLLIRKNVFGTLGCWWGFVDRLLGHTGPVEPGIRRTSYTWSISQY